MCSDSAPHEHTLGFGESRDRTRARCLDLAPRLHVDGIAVAAGAGNSCDLVYATDSIAEQLDELHFTLGEGPGVDCVSCLTPQIHHHLLSSASAGRWPIFAQEAAALGVESVYVYPLAIGSSPLGVLELYGRRPFALSSREDEMCCQYSAAITVSVLTDLAPGSSPRPDGDERTFSRSNVHLACGILAVRQNISIGAALLHLRSTAYAEQRRITSVAQEIIDNLNLP